MSQKKQQIKKKEKILYPKRYQVKTHQTRFSQYKPDSYDFLKPQNSKNKSKIQNQEQQNQHIQKIEVISFSSKISEQQTQNPNAMRIQQQSVKTISQDFKSNTSPRGRPYQQQNQSVFSQNTIKHKLPLAILQYIIKSAQDKHRKQIKNQQNLIPQFKIHYPKIDKSKKLCEICLLPIEQKQFQQISKKCGHQYCQSCLHQYVIYKIMTSQQVECPNEDCKEVLSEKSPLFNSLPLDVRQKYKKLLKYWKLMSRDDRKMCPRKKCEGWVKLDGSPAVRCVTCRKQYCSKCLWPMHKGECTDRQQVNFYLNTLNYRQCNKCKFIVQKSSGCDHMICRCGYQFCYLCGSSWAVMHQCKEKNKKDYEEVLEQDQQKTDWWERCCLGWWYACFCFRPCLTENQFERYFGSCIINLWIWTLRFLGFLVFIIVVIPHFFIIMAGVGLFWFLVCLIFGITIYTIFIIKQLRFNLFYLILSIVALPVTIIGGIVCACYELMNQGFYQFFKEGWELMIKWLNVIKHIGQHYQID